MQPSHHIIASPICTRCKVHLVYQEDPVLGWDVCSHCRQRYDASTSNCLMVGIPSQLPAFSVEFELQADWESYDELDRALILLKHGFLRTKDGSVDEEYKSPIYRSLSPFRAVLPVLATLSDLVNTSCGTHLHVSLPLKDRLRPIHQQVFELLVTYLQEHEEETIAFWGRTFNCYASPLLGCNWGCFNVCTNYETLEFRLPRFRNAEQYLAVVRFCRMITFFLTQQLRAMSDPNPTLLGQQVLARYLCWLSQCHLRTV